MSARRPAPMWRRYARFWGPDADRDLDEELRTHLELRVEDNLARGLSPEAARAEAEARFGDVERVRTACRAIDREAARASRWATLRDDLLADVRYAVRTLNAARTFTLVAVLSLAFGIGANVAIFRLVDTLVLRPLPGIASPGTLVELAGSSLPYPVVRDLQARGPFAAVAGYRSRTLALGDVDGTTMIEGGIVTGDYFRLLGVRAALGRTFTAAEDRLRVPEPVVVLGHGLWKRQFGGDPRVVGRTLRLNGAPFTVIGVAPSDFRGTRAALAPDLWLPVNAWPLTAVGSFAGLDIHDRDWGWMGAVARLAPGDTPERAQARLYAMLRAAEPEMTTRERQSSLPRVVPAQRQAAALGNGPGVRAFVLLLAAAVGLALLIACTNLAGLLLARAARRRHEIGVRVALGATRGRLVRQLLTECLALALLGGAAGLAIGVAGARVLTTAVLPGGIAIAAVGPDLGGRTLVVAVGLSLLSALLFGLLPALQATRPNVARTLRNGRQAFGRSRLRAALVVAQLALCLVLLAGAGFFLRSLRASLDANTGYDAASVAIARVHVGLQRYDSTRAAAFYDALRARLTRGVGGTEVALAQTLPLQGDENVTVVRLPAAGADTAAGRRVATNLVSPGYLRVLGVPLRAGRDFDARDEAGAHPVAIVSEVMARRYWPGGAVGAVVRVGDEAVTIVGVAADARYVEVGEALRPMLYRPLAQAPGDVLADELTVLTRAPGRPATALVPELRAAVRALDRHVPVLDARSFDDALARQLLPQQLAAALLGAYGALTLVLGAVGLYGVIAYAVEQRTREFGVRIALGAPRGHLLGAVLRHGARLVAIGLGIGLALAAGVGQVLASFLFGVGGTDPMALGGGALVLGLVALGAVYVPAWRATRLDAVRALRAE